MEVGGARPRTLPTSFPVFHSPHPISPKGSREYNWKNYCLKHSVLNPYFHHSSPNIQSKHAAMHNCPQILLFALFAYLVPFKESSVPHLAAW